jgi:hypothetical protein
MYTKADFLTAIAKETKILKHLATCVPPSGLDYRPTPGQRSTLELMQYLTIGAHAAAIYAVTGAWEHWEKLDAESKAVTAATFGKALDRQRSGIAKQLKPFNDASLKKKSTKDFSGAKVPLGAGLMAMVLQQLTAYRMQLFLYAKAAGNSAIGTSDVWRGKAAKPMKAAKAT